MADNATLNIVATASKPAVFIGKTDDIDTGSWHGIELNTTSTNNSWEHATIKNGGSGCLVSVRKGTLSMGFVHYRQGGGQRPRLRAVYRRIVRHDNEKLLVHESWLRLWRNGLQRQDFCQKLQVREGHIQRRRLQKRVGSEYGGRLRHC